MSIQHPARRWLSHWLLVGLGCLLASAPGVVAGTEAGVGLDRDRDPDPKILAPYDMSWWSVDGGGGSSSGGGFAVTGSIGQPDAGVARSCARAMEGGVWSGPVHVEPPLFCDGFEDGDTSVWATTVP